MLIVDSFLIGVFCARTTQRINLFGSEPFSVPQTDGQRVSVVWVGRGLDRGTQVVLAARSGVVQRQGLRVVGFGGGEAALHPRVRRMLGQPSAGRLDARSGLIEAGAHVRGAARAGLGFTHSRPPDRSR
ncbi:hypothetical protein LQ384_25150 [Rhodococcus rhodochrous]|uniref:Uncharacterized protein n=1 Tax=Rhodococcus rhodochrous TaxID=1829 RepID=A0AAW4XNB5_RHORH|nr:hypothetical protein [Rhodococcus rhodochrous]MCD2114401.1 hypothetical protein [Rhodococcus rhodochrous]